MLLSESPISFRSSEYPFPAPPDWKGRRAGENLVGGETSPAAFTASIASKPSYPKPTPRTARLDHPGLLHETLRTRRPLLRLARRLSRRQSAPPRWGLFDARAALPIP